MMISPPGGVRFKRQLFRQEEERYKCLRKLRVRNSNGVETKFSVKGKRWFCGERYADAGQCKCGECDGVCGPNNGCPCESCSQLDLKYCGREFCARGKCFCGTCDGRCGPTNGCPCVDCILRMNLVPAMNRFDPARTILYPADDLFSTMVLATANLSISQCPSGHHTFALKKPLSVYGVEVQDENIAARAATCDACNAPIAGRLAHCALCRYSLCRPCELTTFGRLIVSRVMCSAKHPLVTLFDKPEQYMGNTNCSACQLPIVYDDGFFHCPKCSYDLCQACEQAAFRQLRGVWPDELRCPCGAHTGSITFTGGNAHALCCQCEDTIRVSDGFLFAECCPFSICFNCSRQFVRKYLSDCKLTCPSEHVLKAFCSSKQGANICDLCEAPIVYKNGYLRCEGCDFDMCTGCANAAVQQRLLLAQRPQLQLQQPATGPPPLSAVSSDATLAKPTQLLREYNTYLEDIIARVANNGGGGGDGDPQRLQQQQQAEERGDQGTAADAPAAGDAVVPNAGGSTPAAAAAARSRSPPPPPLVLTPSDALEDDHAVRTVRTGKLPGTTTCTVDSDSSPTSFDKRPEDDDVAVVPLTLRIVYETEEWVIPAQEVSCLDTLWAVVAEKIAAYEEQPMEPSSILLDVIENGECAPLHLPRRFTEAFGRLGQDNPVLRIIATLENCPIQGWSLLEKLGKGTFGTVFKAMDDVGFIFAAKEIELAEVALLSRQDSDVVCNSSDDGKQHPGGAQAPSDNRGSDVLLSLQSEIRLVRQLKHENLIEYFGSCEAGGNKFYILMEFLAGGSLLQLLNAIKLSMLQVQLYARQLLSGLSFLHRFSVVHRDVKPDNIMLSASGKLKIVDFGTAKHLGATLSASTTMKGTPLYMAPEIIEAKGCRTSCDIWSVGCTIVQMLTQKRPYAELGRLNAVQLMFHIASNKKGPKWPRDQSEALNDLLEQCFREDPVQRPSAADLLAHPFFAQKF